MKTGIVTYHFVNNFGAALQTYALSEAMKKYCDTEVQIVDYRHWFIRFTDTVRLFPITTNKAEFVSGIKTMHLRLGRLNKFKNFHKNYFNMTKCYHSPKQLRRDKPACDKFVCGSDQIWNPIVTLGVAEPYYLGFEEKKENKISYAASFGVSEIKKNHGRKMRKYLRELGAVSVREKEGISLVKKVSGRQAVQLIDPTFLLEKEDWKKVASKPVADGEYILLYIMQRNEEIYEYVRKIKEELNLKVVEISRYGFRPAFVDESIMNVGPREFVSLFENAKFVVTNSFHGLAFSVIFEKDFYLIPSKKFNSRMSNLLEVLGIEADCPILEEALLKERYDRAAVKERIVKEREKAVSYLKEHITDASDVIHNHKHIVLEGKTDCCGCNACMQICPKKCIDMQEDEEGFRYPQIDETLCVECGLCKKVCPIIQSKNQTESTGTMPKALGGWNKNDDVRYRSSSGGAFSAFAEHILKQGGVVYGCMLNKNLEAVHVGVETLEDLSLLYGSKYIQSNIGETYTSAKRHLENGRKVLFVGTPCQVAGLKSYLMKDYENLFTCDFICHGVPSPLVFRKYIAYLEEKYNDKIDGFRFRHKEKGWRGTGQQMGTIIKFASGRVVKFIPAYKDVYMNGFLDDIYLRPSCYQCQFKKLPKEYADITIADFWGVKKVNKELFDGKGTSLILLNTQRGTRFFETVKDAFYYQKCDAKASIDRNKSLIKSVAVNKTRDVFYRDMAEQSFEKVQRKHLNGFVWAFHKIIKIAKGVLKISK